MEDQTNDDNQLAGNVPPPGIAMTRTVAASTYKAVAIWTATFWGATALCGMLFFVGTLDFSWVGSKNRG